MVTADCKTTKTTCPYCGVGCGILATPQADGSLDIKGDPDHPANFGKLCSKGSALGETISLDGRLLAPEINGSTADWDSALDLVADTFKTTISKHGADSVAFYVSGQILTEDYYVANKLMKGFIGSANIDTNSRLCMASSVAGHKRAFGSDTVPGCYEDLELADLIVLVGSNLAWCHPVLYQRIAEAKLKRPQMKIVLIDPRRTMTSDIADLHLAIRPDGDVPLFSGLLAYLSKNNHLDTDYIANHTNGFEAAIEAAMEAYGKCDAEILPQLCGLSADEIAEFYALFAQTEKVVTVFSQGVNQSTSGTDKVNAIINCHLATGRIGKPGLGPFSITGQPNAMGGREVGGLANMLAAHMDIENKDHRDLVQGFWQSPTIATKAGLKAVDLFDAVASGKIKALWIMATNPVDSMPNADFVRDAIKTCPFVVVSDVVENADTIVLADVKLPSLAWGEKDGTVTNSERRISRQRGLLPAPGHAKADWWQMAEVAKRMGFNEAFDYVDASQIFAEFASLSGVENDNVRDFDISYYDDIALIDYNELEPFQWPRAKGASSLNTRFFANGAFYTPDKKARFIVPKPINQITDISLLTLNTGRIRDQWHTMTRTGKSARLSAHIGEPFCEIHPKDAERLGVQSASLIKLQTKNADIVLRAIVSDRTPQGSLFAPMHWTDQFASNARIDKLVTPRIDPVSGQPALKSMPVTAQPFSAASYGLLISRHKPCLQNREHYWSISKLEDGWKVEFALKNNTDLDAFLQNELYLETELADLQYEDKKTASARYTWFDDARLKAALFLGPTPIAASRSWLALQLSTTFETANDRIRISAGRAGNDLPDIGAIVCSCLSIGKNQIIDAIHAGCTSTDAVGKATSAGTNCGSCRAEINGLIYENQIIAAE